MITLFLCPILTTLTTVSSDLPTSHPFPQIQTTMPRLPLPLQGSDKSQQELILIIPFLLYLYT